MRFHCGISFSWRTIKKFLFPILLGILAYFGFNYIYDSNTIPLGFIKVNALENYSTNYYLNYTDLSSYENYILDNNNVSFKDFVEHIKSLNNVNDYFISFSIINNRISSIILATPSSSNFFSVFGVNGNNNNSVLFFTYRHDFLTNIRVYDKVSDIYNNSNYLSFIDCIVNNNCTISSSTNIYDFSHSNETISIDSNNTYYVGSSSSNISYDNIIYYSSYDLILANNYQVNNSNYYYKNVYVDDELISVNSKFPTYYDFIYNSSPNEPVEPNDPVEPTDNFKFKDKIYWFDDKTTTLGVLISIYDLLFIYCFSILIIKFLTFIKNTRWK